MTAKRAPLHALIFAAPGIAVIAIAWLAPLISLLLKSSMDGLEASGEGIASPGSLLVRTIMLALGVAGLAALIGWGPGRALRGSGWFIRAVCFAAALIPAYAVFYCWWRVLRPGHAIADYAITHDLLGALRGATLGASLVAWSWPIAACIICLRAAAVDRLTSTMLTMDGASWRDRLAAAWRADRGAVCVAFVAIALVTFGETAAFDAAQVATFSSEIRALDATGAAPYEVMVASIPAILLATILSAVAAVVLLRAIELRAALSSGDLADLGSWSREPRRAVGAASLVVLVAIATVLPMGLLAADPQVVGSTNSFGALHARGSLNALVMAAVAGIGGGLVAVAGSTLMLCCARRVLLALFASALLALALPATLIALASASFWTSTRLARVIYDSFMVVSLAEVGRFSAVAFAVGIWCASSFARSEREIWLVHGRSPMDFFRGARPIIVGAFLGGFLLTLALSVTETSIAARLEPPGLDWIASSLLNAIHYQDSSAVSGALIWMTGVSALCVIATIGILGGWMRLSGRTVLKTLLFACPLLLALGCDDRTQGALLEGAVDGAVEALPTDLVVGRTGRTEGRFQMPRALAVEESTGSIFVIDKSARVQRFDADGKFELGWAMPQSKNGKPTGLTVGPDGLIYVADTHEHRVSIFDRDGKFVRAFGSYGQGDGQFVFPSDVVFAPDGRVFVSEYGGNDRIQVFDHSGAYVSQFGSPGQLEGQFARPQSMAFSNDGTELFVADACNHRIQVFEPDGTFLRSLCDPGQRMGELAYPYGIDVLDDGSLLVAEFGNCRVQRIDPLTGDCKGVWGGGGQSVGRLNAPWAVQHSRDRLFIVDSANGRIQSLPLAAVTSPPNR